MPPGPISFWIEKVLDGPVGVLYNHTMTTTQTTEARKIGSKTYQKLEHNGRFLVGVKGKGRPAYFAFADADACDRWLDQTAALEEKREVIRQAQKEKKAAARAAIVNPYKVGDIFTESWGYDQTNVDAYQVVAVGARSVKLRKISLRHVETTSWASANVSPIKDAFLGEAFTKVLQPYGDNDPYVPSVSGHGWMRLWDGKPEHSSWYA